MTWSVSGERVRQPNCIIDLSHVIMFEQPSARFELNLTDCLRDAVKVGYKFGACVGAQVA